MFNQLLDTATYYLTKVCTLSKNLGGPRLKRPPGVKVTSKSTSISGSERINIYCFDPLFDSQFS